MTRVHPTSEKSVDASYVAKKVDVNSLQEVAFSPPTEYDDEDEEAPKIMYEPSMAERILNILLCRYVFFHPFLILRCFFTVRILQHKNWSTNLYQWWDW